MISFRLTLTLVYLVWCTVLILLSFDYTEHLVTGSPLIFIFMIGQFAFLAFFLFHIDRNCQLKEGAKWRWIILCFVFPPAGVVYLGRYYLVSQ